MKQKDFYYNGQKKRLFWNLRPTSKVVDDEYRTIPYHTLV